MPDERPSLTARARPIDGHDGPVHLDQFKPMPTQGKFERVSATDGVPYRSGPGTPNAAVTRSGVSVFDPKPNK